MSVPIIFNIQVESVQFVQASTTEFESRLNIYMLISERKNGCAPDLDQGPNSESWTDFISCTDQPRSVNTVLALIYYFSPLKFPFSKRTKTKKKKTGKKDMILTKHHVFVWSNASCSGCKITYSTTLTLL